MSKLHLLLFQYEMQRKLSSKPFRWTSGRKNQLHSTYKPDLEEMRRVFDKFDADKDGKISAKEYGSLLKSLGKHNVEEEVKKTMKVADTNHDGYIDFDEFMDVHRIGGGINISDIQSAFRVFDLDGDGRITGEEVWEMMKKLGEVCSLEACKKMVKNVNSKGNGTVDMNDFMVMMTKTLKT